MIVQGDDRVGLTRSERYNTRRGLSRMDGITLASGSPSSLPLILPNNMVLLGAPGSGKTTVVGEIRKHHRTIIDISTGALIDTYLKSQSADEAERELRDSGRLVTDELVVGLIHQRLAEVEAHHRLMIWNGAPRNGDQARGFRSVLESYSSRNQRFKVGGIYVVELDVTYETVYARIKHRRVCPICNAAYNLETHPSADGEHCDEHTTTQLVQRKDDAEFSARWDRYFTEQRDSVLAGLEGVATYLGKADASPSPQRIAPAILLMLSTHCEF